MDMLTSIENKILHLKFQCASTRYNPVYQICWLIKDRGIP